MTRTTQRGGTWRRALVCTALVAACWLAIAGCSGDSSSLNGASGNKVYRFGTGNDTVNSLNPFAASSFEALASMRVLYPYLLQYNLDGTDIVGDFARHFTTSEDGKTWTLTTYKSATWSDGKPLTAKDAAWTLTTILKFKDDATSSLAPYVQGLKSAEASDDNTLVLTYSEAQATIGNSIAQIPILPEHVWAPLAEGKGDKLASTPNTSPVTGGSFDLAKYETEKLILFKRNEDFYGAKPLIAGFGYETFTNTDALVNAVGSGQLDGAFDLATSAVATLKDKSGLKVNTIPGTDVVLLGLNTTRGKTKNPSLLNPVVREAIDLAIDRDNLVKTVLLGQGTAVASIIAPSLTKWSDPDIKPSFDPDAANAKLDAAGYTRGSDGIRVADGKPMKFTLDYFNTVDSRLPTLIQKNLRDVGIGLDLRASDGAGFVAAVSKGDFKNFDMSMYDYGPAYDPTTQLSIATCGQQGSLNFIGYCNDGYDQLFSDQSSEVDQTARQKVVFQMQQQLRTEHPVVPLYAGNSISAAAKSLPISVATPLIFPYQSKLWLSSKGE